MRWIYRPREAGPKNPPAPVCGTIRDTIADTFCWRCSIFAAVQRYFFKPVRMIAHQLLLRGPIRSVVFILVLGSGIGLAALDEDIIADPRGVTFRDRRAEQHWQALFEPYPTHPLRHLVALQLREGDRFDALLSARLLYRGDPWTRRGDESGVTQSEWRRRCQPLLVAALRELRMRDDPALTRVDISLLALDGDAELTIAVLVDLYRRNPAFAKAGALRVAVPDHPEALPAARSEEARRLARGLLVDHWGLADADVQRALATGLERGAPRERNAALALIERGSADHVVAASLAQLVIAVKKDRVSSADLDGFALACDRLGALVAEPVEPAEPAQIAKPAASSASAKAAAALIPNLIELTISGRREALSAACALLARTLPTDFPLPTERLATAIASDPDVHCQHARANLLLRRSPATLIQHFAANDPWRQLAEHRAALARWTNPSP